MDSIAVKIAALLEKAESSEFGPEAEALVAKAQELATRYSIEQSLINAKRDKKIREVPIQRRVEVWPRGKHGGKYFVALFGAIANSNNVKYNISAKSDYVNAFGFPSDVDVCERLFSSLQIQMVGACKAAISRGENLGEDARIFKAAFYTTFAYTIRGRLFLASEEAANSAIVPTAENGADENTSGALVLVKKAEQVSDYYKETSNARGSYRPAAAKGYSFAGSSAGRIAGQNARLAAPVAIGGSRTAIR